MNNKNIILLLIALAVAVGAYLILKNEDLSETVVETKSETSPETISESPAEMENKDYVGMTTVEAEGKAQTDGVMFRVVEEDGKPLPTTRDFREGRINASVEGGVVTEYTVETNSPAIEEVVEAEARNNDVIIGMTATDAKAYADANNIGFRIGTIDGEALAVTLDFRPGRITAETKSGVVVGYTVE